MPYELENFFPGDPQHSYRKNETIKLYNSIVSTATRAEIAIRRIAFDNNEVVRFNRWFGPVGANNIHLNTIKRNLKTIITGVLSRKIILRNAADGGGAQINPATGKRGTGVPGDWLAYVRYNQANLKIYLHMGFWQHHNTNLFTGTGVIFHEMSHLFLRTLDHCYLSNNCLQLALNSPNLARNNADNYRLYFEEFMS
jgi:hypothetical protein